MSKFDYVVFDFREGVTMGAVELEAKLNELGAQGYQLREVYRTTNDVPHPIRFIMERPSTKTGMRYE